MLGYPGAGKTTAAKALHNVTGAVHVWADHERRHMFGSPTYSHAENLQLYAVLNRKVEELLKAGHSVIFDTNFNFYKDREKMRLMAKSAGANCELIWVVTPKSLARQRATKDAHTQQTRVLGDMPPEDFDRMSKNLQPPRADENPVELDGTKITPRYVAAQLDLQ